MFTKPFFTYIPPLNLTGLCEAKAVRGGAAGEVRAAPLLLAQSAIARVHA